MEVKHIKEVYIPQIVAAASEEEQQELEEAATKEMTKAVENRGLKVDRYQETLAAAPGYSGHCDPRAGNLRSNAMRQRAEISASRAGGLKSISRAAARTICRSRSRVMYSTGDLPSMRARSNPGRSVAIRLSMALDGSQSVRSI